MNIFDISKELEQLFEEVEENGGELTPQLEKKLNNLEADREKKLEGFMLYIANLQASIESYKSFQRGLAYKKKVTENKLDNVKDLLSAFLGEGEVVKCPVGKMTQYTSETCKCIDPDTADSKYLKRVYKPDIAGAREALLKGEEVTGFEIEKKSAVKIQLNN